MKDKRGLVEARVLVGDGMCATREYERNGHSYIEGHLGQRFGIEVRNLTSGRLELVASVDGLDVHNGQEASYHRRGMVIKPYNTCVFQGYRLSLREVATFRFGGVEAAYATLVGKPRNIGVIGIAVFQEKNRYLGEGILFRTRSGSFGTPTPTPICEPTMTPTPTSTPTPDTSLGRSRGLGAVFGERRENQAGITSFERLTTEPVVMLTIRYEDRAGLETLGIRVEPGLPAELAQRETASAFPTSTGQFATPPVGWTGRG